MYFAPLEQFEIVFSVFDYNLVDLFSSLNINIWYYSSVFFYFFLVDFFNLSYWNISLFRVIFFYLFLFFFIYGSNIGGFIWPKNWQIFFEMIYNFLATTFKEQVGYRGQKYFPFLATTFIFVLILNVFGMIPYEGAITSQLIFNLSLSFTLLVVLTIIGLVRQGRSFLILFLPPKGVPSIMVPLIIFIEIVSYFARGISLGVRLFANIMAGHTLLFIFSTFILQVNILLGFGIFVVIFLVTFLEFFIGMLQAYVFYVLLIIYFRDSIEVSH